MQIDVSNTTQLVLLKEEHALKLFNMVAANRDHLREWLPFADQMNNLEFASRFIEGTIQRNKVGQEYAFLIVENQVPIGRIGVYKIDLINQTGEIGYWIIADRQGKGIVSAGCKALVSFCFKNLPLNRIEIRCATLNLRSFAIPEKLGFKREGILSECEWLSNRFIHHYLYALLKNEYEKMQHT